jgi:SH3-like domain-containing protein
MNRTTAVIMQPVVSVKSSPNDVGTDLFLIHTGSKVEILDDTMSDWTKIKLEEGKEGWVQTDVMEII